MSRFRTLKFMILIAAVTLCSLGAQVASGGQAQGNEFVKRAGPELRLHGQVFRFAGTNNYYLMYKSQVMVDDVLNRAAANGFNVVRTWGSLLIGNEDGSNSVAGIQEGVYFQYWDGAGPAYNDGPNGLERLDYVIYKAGQNGIKLVIPLVNNWNDFGGMDQYVRWRGGQFHDEFYTDPLIRQWYQEWISHLLNRTNIYTGVKYKDNPTIMTWELANEPRCLSAGAYPRSASCTTETLVEWADTMSRYIKKIDNKHLVSVGDEGFYCFPGAADWTEDCGEGVDALAFTDLVAIDVMSFHLYPDHWGKDVAWSKAWIERHLRDARRLRKPAMLGEFGYLDKNSRNPVFKEWTDAVYKNGGSGALYWILSGLQDDGSPYPDYDGFTVYCPSPVCTTMRNFGEIISSGRMIYFPPVADHDQVVTEFETPVTRQATANDISYWKAVIDPTTLDLDPAAAGRQTSAAVYGGTFVAAPDGSVLMTPDAGFSGKAQVSYVVADNYGSLSNPANLVVTVKPDPTGALRLFSFETGVEGWAAGNWQTNAGTVSQSATFATDGSYGLEVITVDGGWFLSYLSPALDIADKTVLKYDLQTGAAGTSVAIALQLGAGYEWCQSPWGWVNPHTTTTVEIDLLNLGCAAPDLSQLQAVVIWFSGNGVFYIDNVLVE